MSLKVQRLFYRVVMNTGQKKKIRERSDPEINLSIIQKRRIKDIEYQKKRRKFLETKSNDQKKVS